MSDKEEFYREEHEYEARMEAYNEMQELRRQQALDRQRRLNGGYTDAEMGCYEDDEDELDEEKKYGII